MNRFSSLAVTLTYRYTLLRTNSLFDTQNERWIAFEKHSAGLGPRPTKADRFRSVTITLPPISGRLWKVTGITRGIVE